MNTTDYSNLSMDEIVFEQRNKQYGAYALREQYNQSILKAILITLAVFILALFISLLMNKIDLLMTALANACKEKTVITPTELPDKAVINPFKKETGGNPDPGPKKNAGFIITTDGPDAPDTAALQTNSREPAHTGSINAGTGAGGTGTDTHDTASVKHEEEAGIFKAIEQMPEFNGGNLTAWIEKELSPPGDESGTALVNFTVNEEGKVVNIKIKQSAGYESLDKEAKRVISSLSKIGFKPGKQKGRPVSVDFEIPISFSLDE